jgi:hypothetical protein
MEDRNQHEQILTILTENNRLLAENNEMLKKMRRAARMGFIFRIIWLGIIIGGPLIIYWYFIQPFLAALPFASGEAELFESQLETWQEYLQQFQQ